MIWLGYMEWTDDETGRDAGPPAAAGAIDGALSHERLNQ